MTLEEAMLHLKDALAPGGGLYSPGWYLEFTPGEANACLDGNFSADDLEAIAVIMRHSND